LTQPACGAIILIARDEDGKMPDVLVRNVSRKALEALRKLAAEQGRSLQQQLRLIIEREGERASFDYVGAARRLRERIARYAPCQPDSAELVRRDRER